MEGDVPTNVGSGGRYSFISVQQKVATSGSGENKAASKPATMASKRAQAKAKKSGKSSPVSEADSNNASNVVYVTVAIDVPIVLTIAGTQLDRYGEITSVNFAMPPTATEQDLSIIFQNTGNYHYRAMAKSILKDASGNIITEASTPVTFSSIVPPYSRKFDLSLKQSIALSPGNYTIISIVGLDDGTLLSSKETKFSIAQSGTEEGNASQSYISQDEIPQGDTIIQDGSALAVETVGNETETQPQAIF